VSARWAIEGLEADLDAFHLGPVDLTLGPGGAVAVLGPSGAGKTTLLRALAGFLRIRSGRILRDGIDVSDLLPEARALGYVPQGLGLFPHRTVAGNVRFPMEIRNRSGIAERTRELLERFRLGSLADRYPGRLSGGEQQRVAIARALAADPELIAWDEPWQGLDVLARHDLGLLLHELRETDRVPVLIVTHDPSLAFSIADRFLVLSQGEVRELSEAAALLRAPSDPFAARFVGFENVFDRSDLQTGGPDPFRSWLLERAGPGGLAFASPRLVVGAPEATAWEGRVRSVRPSPHGMRVEVSVGSLVVTVAVPAGASVRLPVMADRVLFTVDPESIHPLGASGPFPRPG